MLTVDFPELNLQKGDVVLDAGCGTGRHIRELAGITGLQTVGIDKNSADLQKAGELLGDIPGVIRENHLFLDADIRVLPFSDGSFDCVICCEVLEHIADHEAALAELVRVLKPGGAFVLSVPRYLPERICWFISPAYHNEKDGHIRIYRKKELHRLLRGRGIDCWRINYKHALHAPYWWLKCAVGLKNEDHWLVRNYKKFLEWDIMQKPPAVRFVEELLNPLLGKSIVMYLRKS